MSYKAIIIGASGLIGSELVKQATASDAFHEILVIGRKPMGILNPKVREIVIDFDRLSEITNEIKGDVIFSCLGTTRSKTPDPAQYRKIEWDYTLTVARMGLANQCRQFHYVSSLGADIGSSSSYLKLKGEVERALMALHYPSLHIYQPSFLTGERKEYRLGEKLMLPVMRILDHVLAGNLKKYQSIPASTVAKAMLNQSQKNKTGTFNYPSDIIKQLA